MKKIFFFTFLLSLAVFTAKADEGMWTLPHLNFKDMQAKGLKLSAEDIYSINQSSLKDAVVIFGGGCSGEVISDQGLVLTNHHCGYSSIQQHSTVEHDYLKDGFWAMSLQEEIPTPGLSVQFIKEVEDITDMVLPKLKKNLTEEQRDKKLVDIVNKIVNKRGKKAIKKYAGATVMVEEFFGGNQYILFVIQRYTDVRMVGTPPSSVGKFGGDTDNWMWPRHTGDFSLFRIYADENGNPADYASTNKPLKPAKFIPISLAGVKENDFSMIMGFPGRTQRYMTSWEVEQRTDILNANQIYVRGIRQAILRKDMLADANVNIQYASKYAGSANYWKNSIGMNQALKRLEVKKQKQQIEADFQKWVKADAKREQEYGEALSLIENAVIVKNPITNVLRYYSETIFRASEMITFASYFDKVSGDDERIERFYKNFNKDTDRKVTEAMLSIIADKVESDKQPDYFKELLLKYGSSKGIADAVFGSKIFSSKEDFQKYVSSKDTVAYKQDIAYRLGKAFGDKYDELRDDKIMVEAENSLRRGQRLFIKGLMEMNSEKAFAPDANFTMRLTYGTVKPYSPRDGVTYKYYTTLSGVIEKEDPTNPTEFTVPQRIKELYYAKDFGQYANEKGELPVGFIADLDITGGNSGSPVFNDKGELIGTAFDGNWEAMSGDIAFEHQLQRCINLDIRYTLFIIDKYAGCKRLIEEMKIVK